MRKSPKSHRVKAHSSRTKKGQVIGVRDYIRGQGVAGRNPFVKRRIIKDKDTRVADWLTFGDDPESEDYEPYPFDIPEKELFPLIDDNIDSHFGDEYAPESEAEVKREYRRILTGVKMPKDAMGRYIKHAEEKGYFEMGE